MESQEYYTQTIEKEKKEFSITPEFFWQGTIIPQLYQYFSKETPFYRHPRLLICFLLGDCISF